MRIKLTITPEGAGNILPINYQYEISAWIYRMIHDGNAEFAAWLHNKGYGSGAKRLWIARVLYKSRLLEFSLNERQLDDTILTKK
ncbi:MAG: hypothetical protein LAT67_10660 [Balneolales bacterium]|nr:hypothetical protein [Balneolales bacterium]